MATTKSISQRLSPGRGHSLSAKPQTRAQIQLRERRVTKKKRQLTISKRKKPILVPARRP